VALQQELQAKADLEAIVAVAAQAKHVAKSKAMAGKLYAATQTAVRQAAQSRKSACRLKELRQQLHALQYEDTDITGKMHADIQSSLEAEQKTNRRLELELSQQTKAAGRAHTLARARLHSADSSSDSSDSDDGDWAPGRQLAVSSQQPALQVTSWLSSKPNQKYQPQRIIDLCRLLVQNSLPVSGVQGLLFDLASLLTGVKVSKVSLRCQLFIRAHDVCFLCPGHHDCFDQIGSIDCVSVASSPVQYDETVLLSHVLFLATINSALASITPITHY